jgi:hypothetical protein
MAVDGPNSLLTGKFTGKIAISEPILTRQFDGGRQYSEVAPAYLGLDSSGKPVVPTIGQPYAGTPDRIRSGGMQTWDVSLFKNVPIPGERHTRSIQLRSETYNLFNHSNFGSKDFGATLNLPGYSVVNGTGTYTPHLLQLGQQLCHLF